LAASQIPEFGGSMMSDTVTVDRKKLLKILVHVENALQEIQQLKKELAK
jgi:hypothetical protein